MKKETDLTEWLSNGNKIKRIARNKSSLPKTKKKQRRRNLSYKAKRREQLTKKASELENNLPKSEQWFRSLYKKNMYDKYNKVFNSTYIPDVINKHYKYVIEIDGSIHDSDEQKAKDAKKDDYFLKRGYLVIRITAYDMVSFDAAMTKIQDRINIYL
jgi:very-short-patch-repair endonuclease